MWRPTVCRNRSAELNWIFCRDSDDFEEATDTLIRALDTDLKWVRAHTRLLTRAIEWDANGRNNSFVLRGEDLRSAEQWLAEAGAQKERQPTALQTEYIIASRKAAARRQRITLGAVTFGLLVAIVCSLSWRYSRRHKAVEQETKAKNTSVQADFDLAVMYQQTVGQRGPTNVRPPCSRPANVRRRKTAAAIPGFAATRLALVFALDRANAP